MKKEGNSQYIAYPEERQGNYHKIRQGNNQDNVFGL